MIYELFFTLFILLVIAYFLNKKDIIAPSFIFALSFVFSAMWAVGFSDIWGLENFHLNTYLVIVLGVLEFIIISWFISLFFCKKDSFNKKIILKEIKIDLWIKVICLIFVIFFCYMCYASIISITNGSWSNISGAIDKYDEINKFSNVKIALPKFIGIAKLIINFLTYWYIYVCINNYIVNKKIDKIAVLIILFGIITSMCTGGRSSAANILISIPVITLILVRKQYSLNFKLSLKTKLMIIILPIVFLFVFIESTALLGREVKGSKLYYLGIYCGAEIKNLDYFLNETNNFNITRENNNQTFYNLISWLQPKITGVEIDYKLDLPFVFYNNMILGNVYTIFYAFIYDYGYAGVFFCVILMAIISQIIYGNAKNKIVDNMPSVWIIAYGYIVSALLFSFFSNRFYEQVFDRNFVYGIVFWNIFNYLFVKIKLRIKNNNK